MQLSITIYDLRDISIQLLCVCCENENVIVGGLPLPKVLKNMIDFLFSA
jgi:hypothetical protein